MTSRKLSASDKSAILNLERQPTETTSNLPQEISYSVANAIPGRIRFHIPRLATDSEYAHKLKVVTEFDARTTDVRVNPAASCIVINYQPGVISDDQMHSHLVKLIQTAPKAVVPTEETVESSLGAIFDALVTPIDSVSSMDNVRNTIMHGFDPDALRRLIYSENLDEVAKINHNVSLPQAIAPDHSDSFFAQKRSSLAAVLVFTSPGTPLIFQGQEFLEGGAWSYDVVLKWDKLFAHGGIHDLYRDLIRLKCNWYNNTCGLRGQNVYVHHVNENDKVIAFHRWENGGRSDDVVVVVNMGDRAYDSYSIGFPRGGLWRVRFNSDWEGYSPNFGNHPGYDTKVGWTDGGDPDHMPFRGNVGIGSYSALILSQ